MILAHDVLAETNPAFCAYIIGRFCESFRVESGRDPELPLVYLSLPLALSEDLGEMFNGTNRRTGLHAWVDRHPEATVGLAERIDGSLQMVTDAVRFGCYYSVLTLTSEGATVGTGTQQPPRAQTSSLGFEITRAVKRAQRLGYWFGSAGSAARVFDILGVTV